jgi:hypothetical protein
MIKKFLKILFWPLIIVMASFVKALSINEIDFIKLQNISVKDYLLNYLGSIMIIIIVLSILSIAIKYLGGVF